MLLNPSGGVIAAISATREVFIDENGLFSAAIGSEAFATGSDGLLPTLGEAVMRAKNRLASPAGQSNENKLRYTLLGDPAMRYAMPDAMIRIDSINGMSAADSVEIRPEIQAGGTAVISGTVLSPLGTRLNDFNGAVSATLYDAERSVTTSGRMTALIGSLHPAHPHAGRYSRQLPPRSTHHIGPLGRRNGSRRMRQELLCVRP